MKHFPILALLMGTPAAAATVHTWSGAGPHACRDACSQEWAIEQLSPAERAQLEEAMRDHPEPEAIAVSDGDVFTLMSYAPDGEPVAYRTTTVAALDHVEWADGWVLDGWSFVKLRACGNWAIIAHGQSIPVMSYQPAATPPVVVVPPRPWTPWVPPSTPVPWNPPVEPCCVTPEPPPVAPVPLPAPVLLLAGAFASLTLLRRRK